MKIFQNKALNKYFIDHVSNIEQVANITQYMAQQQQTFEYCPAMELLIYQFRIDFVIDLQKLKVQLDNLGEIQKQNIISAILKEYIQIHNYNIQHGNLSNHESILIIKEDQSMDMVQAIEKNQFKVMFIHYRQFRQLDNQDYLRQDFNDLMLVFDLLLPNKYKVRRLHIWGFNPDIKRLEQLVSKLEQRRNLVKKLFNFIGFKKRLDMYQQKSEKKFCKNKSFLYEYISSELSLNEDCIDGTYYMVNLTKEIDIITEEYLRKKDRIFQNYFEKSHQESHTQELNLSRIIGDDEQKNQDFKPVCLRVPDNMMENYIFKQALKKNYNIVNLSELQLLEILSDCKRDLFPREYKESCTTIDSNKQIL